MERYQFIIDGVWLHMKYGFGAALFASLFEIILPVAERHTLRSRLRGFSFAILYYITAMALIIWIRHHLNSLGVKPLLSFDLTTTVDSTNPFVWLLGYTLFPFAAMFVFDFLFYWFHRLQHAVPFLWRYHRVHHSIREMNAFNNYHHVSEEFFRLPFIVIPLLLLIDVQTPQVLLAVLFLRVHATLIHSKTALTFWIFKYVWVEPFYHRVHHSVEQHHWNRNFASTFPIWDMLFGTAYYGRKRETFGTGLPDQGEPTSIREYLFPPKPPAPVEGSARQPS